MTDENFIAQMFVAFDAALIADELTARGVSPDDAERLITMGSKHFRVFLKKRAWDEKLFYGFVEARSIARANRRVQTVQSQPNLPPSAPIPVPTTRRRVRTKQTEDTDDNNEAND